jgi:hypothetical protein
MIEEEVEIVCSTLPNKPLRIYIYWDSLVIYRNLCVKENSTLIIQNLSCIR